MAQQNGGQFDPMLFGNYRESQDAVLNNDFGGFFDEAFPLPDLGNFGSPLSLANVASPAPRRDLLKETEDKQNGEPEEVPVKGSKMIPCNKIWLVPNAIIYVEWVQLTMFVGVGINFKATHSTRMENWMWIVCVLS